MKKTPFVIIFDIDKTIIGIVNILAKEHDLLEFIYNTCKKKGINAVCPPRDVFDMQEELKDGLLRPFVKEFIAFCNKKFKNAEVFLYTNSSYDWTNNALGKNIEKALNIKVNRPFFTRENSISNVAWKKSLANIYPTIIKSLRKKYPAMNDEKVSEYVFNNRTIFVDDVKDNIFAYTSRQLVCPEYKYWYYYDVYEKLITKYKMSPRIFDDKDILKYMDDNSIYIYNKNGNVYQQNKEYINIANMYNMKYAEISKGNDTYFKDLIAELSKKSVSDDCITDKNIKTINKVIQSIQPPS
jgi:hypothetical protein